MFSFNFASKMLNTIMGTEEQAQQPGGQPMGAQPQQSMIPGQAGMRPMGGGFPQVRPTPQGPGAAPRPGFPGPPTFSGPRPSPGVRAGPPSFGGPPRPTVSTMGTPHRFNGPQPPPSQQQQPQQHPQQQQQQMQPQQHPQQLQQHPQQMQQHPQQQQQHPQQMQQHPQQQPGQPGQMPRGMPQMSGMGRPPSPGQRPRGPGPGFIGPGAGPNQPRPPGVAGPQPGGAPVPDVDLSHLSAEERAMIENVMAKAQQLEQGPPAPVPAAVPGQIGPQRIMRPEAQHPGIDLSGGRLCPLCRQRDIIGRDGIPGQECTECRTIVCSRCGGMSPHPETKRPEWTCGNCINKRRRNIVQGPVGNTMGQPQQNIGQRPMGPYGTQLQQPMQTIDPDGGRRGSGVGLQGGPQQQPEREFDKIEAKEMMIGSWETDTKHHHRRPSFEEIFSPERAEQSEELYESPSGSPVDVEFNYPHDPSFPDHTQSMSTPFSASASQAKPSFVTNNKLHSRSISIDMAEQQERSLSPPQNGFDYPSVYERSEESSFSMGGPSTSTFPSATTTSAPADPPQAPPMDEKTSALMEELTKLQSAVDSTLKRRQRQKLETEEDEGDYRLSSPIRSRSPSPSPSPRGESPVRSGGSLSPLQFSSHRLEIQSPDKESPESPDVPGPRKAIVLKEHDLDDYKSSTDEESESDDSDEDRKGMVSGEVYYDHSPGEVYTIQEEEDEGGSPTGGDLVTSLKKRPGIQPPSFPGDMGSPRRRMVGQEMQAGLSPDQRNPLRPQLRPQRSLDNRLPCAPQMDMSTSQPMDQQGNIYATTTTVNTQAVSQAGIVSMDNQGMSQSTNFMGVQISNQQNAMMGVTSSSATLSQQQSMYASSIAGPESQLQAEMNQRSIPHPQQLEQSGGDNKGVGVNVNDWNNLSSQTGMMGPTSGVSVSSTDQSSTNIMQSYPQQQPTSTYSQLPTSTGQSQMTLQQQPQQTSQIFPQHQTNSPMQTQQSSFQLQQAQTPQQQQHQQQQQQQFQNQPLQNLQLQNQPLQSSQQFPNQLQGQQNVQSQQIPNQQNMQIPGQQALGSQPLQVQGTGMQSQQLQQLQTQQAQAQQLAAQQQSWQQQSQQNSQMYDQTGRLIPNAMSPYSQTQGTQQVGASQQNQQPDQYQQAMNLMQQQYQQQGGQGVQQIGVSSIPGPGNVPIVNTSQAGPGAKSISGLLADFSRALGLGSTSPRPSPSEDKSLNFPLSSSSMGSAGMAGSGQPLSPYDPYQQQIPQQISHQQSAFASIPDSYQRQNQQLSYLPQSSQTSLQSHIMGAQNLQYGSGSQAQPTLVSSSQQYVSAALASQQPFQMMTQQQQQAGNVGVGVLGALSPAQAHMYQQQMAMQHQQQHMKKRGRGSHLTPELRRDGSGQTVLIGGQGLAVTPSGMAIGALTPAVVTSLGTFIGGGQTILGTQLMQQPMAVTPLGTPIGTPVGTPRSGRDLPGGGDSSDTMSETDSQKSLRMRRKLPCLPPDQEAAPLPSTKKRDRQRSQEQFRSLSPLRMSSMDGTLPGRSYPFSSLSLSRPSASESNLRKISMGVSEPVPRPGSALGLLQASSIVSSLGGKPDMGYPLNSSLFSTSSTFPGMRATSGYGTDLTTTTSVLSGLYPSHKAAQESWNANLAELAACLPPDLRHLLNKGGPTEHDLSGLSGIPGMASGLGDSSLNSGSHLPSYMRTLREQLQEERRQLLSEERRRLEQLRERDRELGARLDAVTSRAGSDGLRSREDLSRNVGISRSAGASPLLSRKLKGHRRQLSDPKLSLPFSPIQEDGELLDFDRISADLLRPPYKSYEYESLEDSALLHHRPSNVQPQFDWDHSQSYLTSSWAAAGGVLRETAINSMGSVSEDEHFRSRVASRFLSRRNSEGETSPSTSRMTSSNREKRHHLRKHRKSRSWHPSPYVSEEEEEEEEEMMSREEKKARIKAEIARRRQQMQERGGIHNELIRMRDGSDHERHSVLKSVDQLIRDQYGRYEPHTSYGRSLMYSAGSSDFSGHYPSHGHSGLSGNVISPSASEEDRSIERIASTFRSDELYYERLGEMSPMATDSESMGSELGAPAAMPILPDMPTRSRRLLEDLGSAPIGLNEGGRGGSSSSQNMKGGRQPQSPTMGPPTPASSRKSHASGARVTTGVSESRKQSLKMSQDQGDYGIIPRGRARKLPKTKKVTPPPCHNNAEGSEELAPKSQTLNLQRSETKYQFPVKRYLLTRDMKDSSLEGNGIGMKVVGGKEILESNGILAAYVAKIFPDKLVDNIGEIQEGDVILEWNGVSLENKTFEEVATILADGSQSEEIEAVLRTDYNILTGKQRPAAGKFSSRNGGRTRSIDVEPMGGSQFLCHEDKDPDYVNGTCPLDSFQSSLGNLDSMRQHLRSESSYIDGNLDSIEIGQRGRLASLGGSRLVKSPSSSTEATNTSAGTSSIHQSTNLLEDASKPSHHLAIPSEMDLRKRSTSSLPPSLAEVRQMNDQRQLYTADQYGRKGSENMSIKSMGPISAGNERKRRIAAAGVKKGAYGQIQLQICHDPKANILYVTVLKARLPKQKNEDGTDHVQVDPFVTVYLLPDRVLENQRRTRHVPMCSSPQWNQTMVYPSISVTDLKEKYLEVSVKNYNPTGDDDELFGKVVLYLSDDGILDEQPHSYSLRLEEKPCRRRSSQRYLKSEPTSKTSTTKQNPDTFSRCPVPGEYDIENKSPETPPYTSQHRSRFTFGKMSLFTPRTFTSPSSIHDCHGAFCTIL